MAFSGWGTTAASNTNSATGVNFDEGQQASTVNDSAREMMAQLKDAVVDKTSAQTLTNKTLTSPVINDPTGTGFTRILDRDATENEVVSSTTETTVYSYSVPANTLSTNRKLRLMLIGDYLNDSGSSVLFTVRVKFGATTIFDSVGTGELLSTSSVRRGFHIRSEIDAANAADAQRAFSELTYTNGALALVGVRTTASKAIAFHASLAIDTTAAATLAVTVQHGTSGASISFRCQSAQLELL